MCSKQSFDSDYCVPKSTFTLKDLLDSMAYKTLMEKFPGYKVVFCLWNYPGFGINNEGYRMYHEDELEDCMTYDVSSGSFYDDGCLYRKDDNIEGKCFTISGYSHHKDFKDPAMNLYCHCGMMGYQHRAKTNDSIKTYFMFIDKDEIIDISKEVPEEYGKYEMVFQVNFFGQNTCYIICSHKKIPNGMWEHYARHKSH